MESPALAQEEHDAVDGRSSPSKTKSKKSKPKAAPKRYSFKPGSRFCAGQAAEDQAAQAVRSACRQLRPLLTALGSFAEEAQTLRQAMEVVAEKIKLLAAPAQGPGPVHCALAKHPGVLERLCVRLVARLEGFREQGVTLHRKLEKQHGASLSSCGGALRLWLHRREVGAAPGYYRRVQPEAEEGSEPESLELLGGAAIAAAQRVQEVFDAAEAELCSWKSGLANIGYMPGEELRLPAAPRLWNPEEAAAEAELLLTTCGKRHDA
eukprot:TRINITY_DN63879_c0_g1_i1.p1 TRINITY_DN63879_c0_g1~~TRINITY_DN63879_c0_g1_i1.p1  ORF type:complete len:265 (-),score=78.81 TRINITY_DN63879_c0_g1_i1:17-811(-)